MIHHQSMIEWYITQLLDILDNCQAIPNNIQTNRYRHQQPPTCNEISNWKYFLHKIRSKRFFQKVIYWTAWPLVWWRRSEVLSVAGNKVVLRLFGLNLSQYEISLSLFSLCESRERESREERRERRERRERGQQRKFISSLATPGWNVVT